MWRKSCILVVWHIVHLFWVVETKEMHPLPPFMLCTSGCVLLSFLKSTHILLCGGSPRADFFGTMTTGDAHGEMLLVMMPALSNVLISLRTHS